MNSAVRLRYLRGSW